MGYYDGYDEYDEDDEYEEKGMDATKITKEGGKLSIQFDTECFARDIEEAVCKQLRDGLYQDILNECKKEIFDSMKEKIMLSTHEIVKDMVTDFLENEKVTVGGSVWGDDERKELTLTQYSKQCIKKCIEEGKFRVFTSIEKDPYTRGRYKMGSKEYSFGEYVAQELGIGNEAKAYFDSEIQKIRSQVSSQIKDAFDESTKTLLSNAVLQVLMSNDTYKKIQTSIACIADKAEKE